MASPSSLIAAAAITSVSVFFLIFLFFFCRKVRARIEVERIDALELRIRFQSADLISSVFFLYGKAAETNQCRDGTIK